MAVANRAPLCVSCAALMAPDTSLLPPSNRLPDRFSKRFLPGPHASGWCRDRFLPSSRSLLSMGKKRRRRRVPSSCLSKITCSFSDSPEVITASSWNHAVLQSDVPVLVEFWASWCGPCRMVHRVIEEIAQEYTGRIKCYKLNTDVNPQVASFYGIERIPTVLLFKNGEKLQSFTGTLPASVYVTAIEQSLSQ